MQAAGFVLVGGRSSRMGCDKALLPFGGQTLAAHVAAEVFAAAGSVTLVGDPDRYAVLGLPVIRDRVPGNGPLGGIAAAVHASPEWALVVACDMPAVTREYLAFLLADIDASGREVDCIVPESGAGLEPLCALYHHRALPLLDSFLDHKFLRMQDVVRSLQCRVVPAADPALFRNLNTPEDLPAHG
jgi:molybdopterin-guanine dinucleotide biosynthesis protein A